MLRYMYMLTCKEIFYSLNCIISATEDSKHSLWGLFRMFRDFFFSKNIELKLRNTIGKYLPSKLVPTSRPFSKSTLGLFQNDMFRFFCRIFFLSCQYIDIIILWFIIFIHENRQGPINNAGGDYSGFFLPSIYESIELDVYEINFATTFINYL